MSRKKMNGGDTHQEDSGHGNRPWVYFMIDSFFLVTQFFVLTFHVKADEVILPQRLPPGGGRPAVNQVVQDPKEQVTVHVMRDGGAPTYRLKSSGESIGIPLDQFLGRIADTAQTKSPDKLSVRISYEGNVPFGDVMPIFNVCSKLKISECGLIPLRATERQ